MAQGSNIVQIVDGLLEDSHIETLTVSRHTPGTWAINTKFFNQATGARSSLSVQVTSTALDFMEQWFFQLLGSDTADSRLKSFTFLASEEAPQMSSDSSAG